MVPVIEWLRTRLQRAYERQLERAIDDPPEHVAVIQDGNRRYARERGDEATDGHREGAKTTQAVLEWCEQLGVEELTLYAFSTENFDRPQEQLDVIFDLAEEKLYEFADAEEIHENEVSIRAIGDLPRLPERVRDAIDYAERRTADYDQFVLNVALAYGGRERLLSATRDVVAEAAEGDLDPEEIDVDTVADRLYDRRVRDVDLIVRTGGVQRTSNFLPWHANGNEAAVYFCAPYWPEFSRADFLRGLRTYEHREESWRRTRARRGIALLRALGGVELAEARETVRRCRDALPAAERPAPETDATDVADPADPSPSGE
ncbi:UDP diphosphate synthase [Salinarchaeum sp. Harcht-Bsk1]|nr:UDP diphosphate synthase [Salinarchaeum sp. Harcht-Bsk1]